MESSCQLVVGLFDLCEFLLIKYPDRGSLCTKIDTDKLDKALLGSKHRVSLLHIFRGSRPQPAHDLCPVYGDCKVFRDVTTVVDVIAYVVYTIVVRRALVACTQS